MASHQQPEESSSSRHNNPHGLTHKELEIAAAFWLSFKGEEPAIDWNKFVSHTNYKNAHSASVSVGPLRKRLRALRNPEPVGGRDVVIVDDDDEDDVEIVAAKPATPAKRKAAGGGDDDRSPPPAPKKSKREPKFAANLAVAAEDEAQQPDWPQGWLAINLAIEDGLI